MAPATPKVLSSDSSVSNTASDAVNSITSPTFFDLFSELQESVESAQDPTLPKPPSFSHDKMNKKRNRDEYLASSSDAPLFSSDDLPTSSAEHYDQPRYKPQYRISWFQMDGPHHRDSAPPSARKQRLRGPFKRTDDSGVWLGSDESMEHEENEENDQQDAVRKTLRVMESGGSIDGDDELWHEDEGELDLGEDNDKNTQTLEEKLQQALVKKALQLTEDPGGFEGPVFPYWQKQPAHLMGFHSVQQKAQKKVTLCVEEGGEVVDLSYVIFLFLSALLSTCGSTLQLKLFWIGLDLYTPLPYER